MSGSRAMTAALHNYARSQSDRDELALAKVVGTEDRLVRERAVAVLGSEDTVTAAMTGARLRGSIRRTGTVTPEDARLLVAAEIVEGVRTEIGREVEALVGDALARGVIA